LPYNPKSKARLNEFLEQLFSSGITAIHSKQSIYTINGKNVSIRTTTKPGPVYWYDASIKIINAVDYFIYQMDSKYNFVLFPTSFLKEEYRKLKDSNRPNAKIFYIDWHNKLIASKPSYEKNIEPYCCSTKDNFGEWEVLSSNNKNKESSNNLNNLQSDQEYYSIDDIKAFEGYKQDRLILSNARNQRIAKERKSLDKHTCQVCGFSLDVSGKFVIECHHLHPLSETSVVETTINDLISLCPTCHRIAHLRKPPYTPQEIDGII